MSCIAYCRQISRLRRMEKLSFDELKHIWNNYFAIELFNIDFQGRIALISLINYLYFKLTAKKPDVTYYQIIKQLAGFDYPENVIKGLAIMCESFGTRANGFPTFGLSDKEIPNKIKEMLGTWLPF